jgi:hypothetical protein
MYRRGPERKVVIGGDRRGSSADVTGELSVPEPTNDAPWSGDFDRASGQLPGLRQAPGDEDDDFSAWWALFRPGDQ